MYRYEAYKEDILASIAANQVANVTFDYGGKPPVVMKWERNLGAERSHNRIVVTTWTLIFGLLWFPIMILFYVVVASDW